MGDPEAGPQPSGLLPEQVTAYADCFSESRSIDDARWNKAEQRTAELIKKIKGTQSSEERRKDVADYVGSLIRKCFDCQVSTFGSVPLKTYLPDGDIDLTIVSRDPRLKDTWANDVRSVLERLERSQDGKFRVKEVQYINAEVKLIKCHVENIVVDISFNQLGGLCTLCFLEEVDRVIGKDHFFKRSIILVKAWCYYESAILGAHHGLISTYALETLVLYIFHVFHPSLRGPLEVLLRFLEFFSRFDWHKYAVSVWGPVPLASLPEMIAEAPKKDGGELLLSKAFLDGCLEDYSVFLTGQDSQGRAFTAKHLNVVDPLRAGNNLGRSVNQTSFNRIVRVLGHSADKLLRILVDPSKDIDEHFWDKKTGYFKRTKDRLTRFEERRPDAANGVPQLIPSPPVGLIHQSYQNGATVKNVQENGDRECLYGTQTYYVNHNLQSKPEGSNLDPRNPSFVRDTQMGESTENNRVHSATSNSGSDGSSLHKASLELGFGNKVQGVTGTNGSLSSASESSLNAVHSLGRGSISSNEVIDKPVTEKSAKTSKQTGDARDLVRIPSQSSQRRDLESTHENPLKSSISSRSNYTQTNFENNGVLLGNSELPSLESSQRNPNPSVEGLSEGPLPVTYSSPTLSKDGAVGSGWVGEQPLYMDHNGGLDSQAYVQRRLQDSAGRGSMSVIPQGQASLVGSHLGQIPIHAPTSMALSSTRGHVSLSLSGPPPSFALHSVHPSSVISESPVGLVGPRTGQYYTVQPPRGPPVPPLPPGYLHAPTLATHLSTIGEIPNASSRLLPYPSQQGEEKGFEQKQREVWQHMEQIQVHDHRHKYGYFQPVSSMSSAVATLPQHLNFETSFVTTSVPAVVTSVSSHYPANLSVPRASTSHLPGNSRVSHSGSSTNSEGQEPVDNVQVEVNGKPFSEDGELGNLTVTKGKLSSQPGTEAIGRGSKNPKHSKEKRISNRSKSLGNDDTAEVGISDDGVASSNAESLSYWPAQGVVDDNVLMVQGYPQIISTAGPVLRPLVYTQLLSSSLAPQVNGIMVTDSTHYPSARTTVGQSGPPQTLNQLPTLSVGIPSVSPRVPVVELVNGSANLTTTQRQRPSEGTPLPPNVYYPTGNHFPVFSMYNSAYPIYKIPEPAVIGLDYFNGLHVSNYLESYNDANVAMAEDLRLRISQQDRPGVGERLTAAGVSTSAVSRTEAAALDTRASDAVDGRNFSADLLSSDLGDHLRNLDYARQCQTARMHVPMYMPPQFLPPSTKYFQDYRPWEGPGRPVASNPNMIANVVNHGHGLVQGLPSANSSARMVGNFPRTFTGPVSYGGDEPKSHGGTGPFLPNPRPYFRERQSSGSGRNQHGGYSQDRSERSDREANQMHGPRFRGNGRGQSKYEPRSQLNNISVERGNNIGVERNSLDGKGGDRVRDMHNRQQEGQRRNGNHFVPGVTLASPSPGVPPATVLSTMSTGIPVEMSSVPIMTGNGKSSGPLEFGSLGPVQMVGSQGGSESDHGFGHVSALRNHELGNAQQGPTGSTVLSIASVNRTSQAPTSPKQRVTQMAYQLKEEDFPPLSICGQHGSSSSGLNSGSTSGSQSSPYPTCIVMPTW